MTEKLKKNAKYRHVNNPKYVIQVVDTKKKVALVRVLNTTEGHGTKGDLYLIPRLKVDHYQRIDVNKDQPKARRRGVARWVVLTNEGTLTLNQRPVTPLGGKIGSATVEGIKKIVVRSGDAA